MLRPIRIPVTSLSRMLGGQLENMKLYSDGTKNFSYEVFVRVAGDGERIYLDLCNPNWEVVEITATGYRVLKESPVVCSHQRYEMLPAPGSWQHQ